MAWTSKFDVPPLKTDATKYLIKMHVIGIRRCTKTVKINVWTVAITARAAFFTAQHIIF